MTHTVIWKIPDQWRTSKFYGPKSGGRVLRISFKVIDEEHDLYNKTVYLNLDTADAPNVHKWLPFIIEGRNMNVHITPGKNYINKYADFIPGPAVDGKKAKGPEVL